MSRRAGFGVAASVGLLAAAVWLAPVPLREVDLFRVRQVELLGVTYLAPESVLVALALAPDRNLFDPVGEVEERARALPGVVGARVERRLPGTLRIHLVEREAVAFAPGPAGLVALDSAARPLPYDPTETGLDLPVVPRPDSALVRTLWRVRAADSSLYREVQSARWESGDVLLELAALEVVVTSCPEAAQIRAVSAVRASLAAEGRRAVRLDARFSGRVIVRRGDV